MLLTEEGSELILLDIGGKNHTDRTKDLPLLVAILREWIWARNFIASFDVRFRNIYKMYILYRLNYFNLIALHSIS